MIVIRYLRYYPKLIFSKSMFRNWDNSYGVIKGPLEVFTKIKKKFHHCNINSTQVWIFSTQKFKLSSPKPQKTKKNYPEKNSYIFLKKKIVPIFGMELSSLRPNGLSIPKPEKQNQTKKTTLKIFFAFASKIFSLYFRMAADQA